LQLFLDSNIFLSYATDFEKNHKKSVRLFHGNFNRYSGIRVRAELNKIRRRRWQLYEDLYAYLDQNKQTNEFVSQITLSKNDRIHVEQLLNLLSKMSKEALMLLLRKISRIIEQGVQLALSMTLKPLIPISGDLSSEKQIAQITDNLSDAEILVDALCWAEKNHGSKITYCTTDYGDVLNKRVQIYGMICRIRAYSLSELPLEISSLDELVPN
jgi:hypothetical protein